MSDDGLQAGTAVPLIFADQPLSRAAEDLLHRVAFTGSAARLLDGLVEHAPSTVVGLVGPWGSGKTSTVNFIVGRMQHVDRVVRLDPWMVGGPAAVAQEVVTAVTRALRGAGLNGNEVRAVNRYLRAAVAASASAGWALGGAVAALHGVPLAAELAAVVGDATRALSTSAAERNKVKDAEEATAEEALRATSELLRARRAGVLVVVDDVDRLQPDELLALFKAIRLLGRLPYVHYLLVYDERTTLDVLAASGDSLRAPGRALAYLEKVVPVRLEQPEVTVDHLLEMLGAGWADLTSSLALPLTPLLEQAWNHEVEALFVRCLLTPRAVGRFFMQLRLTLDLIGPDDVDVVDLAVLTVLRLHQPDLYRSLSRERELLTAFVPVDVDDTRRERIELLLRAPDGVADREWEPIAAGVRRLFPAVSHVTAEQWLARRQPGRRGPRAQDEEVVDRFFALSPLAGDLSAAKLSEAVRDSSTGTTSDATVQLRRALSPAAGDRAAVAGLQRLLRKLDDVVSAAPPTPEGAAALVSAVCAAAPFPRWPGLDPDARAVSLIATLLDQAVDASGLELDVVSQADSPDEGRAPRLWLLARAQNSRSSRSPGGGRTASLTRLHDAAWSVVLASVAAGDESPVDAIGELGAWAAASMRWRSLADRVEDALDSGVEPLDLLARLLPLARSRGSDGSDDVVVMTTPEDADALVEAVGIRWLEDHVGLDALQREASSHHAARATDPLGGPPPAPTWADRRSAAAAAVLASMAAGARRTPRGELERSSLSAPIGAADAATSALRQYDLRMVMTVVVPEVAQPLDLAAGEPDDLGDEGWVARWEQLVRDQLERSPAAAWVARGPDPAEPLSRRVGADRGRRLFLLLGVRDDDGSPDDVDAVTGPAEGIPQERALHAQVVLGTAPGAADGVTTTLTVALGLRLRRLPEPGRTHGSWAPRRTEPAALADVAVALLALLRSAPVASAALRAVPAAAEGVEGEEDRAAVHLLLELTDDIAAKVHIPLEDRLDSGRTSTFPRSASTAQLTDLAAVHPQGASERHVVRTLEGWLSDAGWRDGVSDLVASAVEGAHSSESGVEAPDTAGT